MTQKEELEDLVARGPGQDLFLADEARHIVESIDRQRAAIDGSSYELALYAMKGYAIERFILATTRLFEQEGRNPLYSLPAVVRYLRAHAAEMYIAEPVLLKEPLQRIGIWTSDLDATNHRATTLAIAERLALQMPTPNTNPALEGLRKVRDKFLAHRENIDPSTVSPTTWKATEPMFKFAKCAALAIAGGYCSTGLTWLEDDEKISSDAQRAGVCVSRIIFGLPSVRAAERDNPERFFQFIKPHTG